jgi:hypothetical protein
MDAGIGIFTAPVAGAYYFTFSAVANGINTKVQLKLNDAIVGSAFGSGKQEAMALVCIVNVQKNDTIWLELVSGGSISADYGATFTGRLLPSNSIYFDVGRNSDFENPRVFSENGQVIKDTDSTIITFNPSKSIISVDGGMDASKGIFTAPVDGAYHFAFSGLADKQNEFVRVRLTVNDVVIASTWGQWSKKASLPIASTVKLRKGDRVSLQLDHGIIQDDSFNSFTHFIGYFIEEESCLSSEGVYFHIGRKTSFSPDKKMLTLVEYERKGLLTAGSGLDVDSGVFTVPHSGVYQFTFSGLTGDGGDTLIELILNGERIGASYGLKYDDTLWIADLIDAKTGDKVAIRSTGALYDSDKLYTHFTGQLVAPKC